MQTPRVRAAPSLLSALALLTACTGQLGAPRVSDDAGPDADDAGERADVAPDASPPDGDAEPEGDAELEGDAGTDADEEEGPPPARFAFAVFGDNQFATTSCTSGVPERRALPAAIVEAEPDFVIHTGDLMDHGYEDGAYEQFESCYETMLAALPLFPTMGNHDAGYVGIARYEAYLERQLFTTNAEVCGPGYAEAFAIAYEDDPQEYSEDFDHPTHRDDVPSGVSFETFYAFRHQNAYFLSLEVGTRYWSNTPRSWMRAHLTAARSDPTIEHVFVYLHHPIYSTTMHDEADGESTGPVRRAYEPLFQEFDVTMVFSGHAHLYDRFYVPDDGTPTRASPPPSVYPHDRSGVHYVVTGGGGGPLNPCNPEREETSYDYAQARRCDYHFLLVDVEGSRIVVSVIGVEGTADDYSTSQWDEFALE